ncbi:P-loop containing nucleoside triphosphate hydrolase protein [Parachaetomium inaequale]|uniref:P-loop containing nucleoside triphosphate hydrolase protein n=1 Tax=Parachaetomium inaequale TaxID=2588326 RepID=A0AAN6PGQ3_9PEZI|nr:P-loop containing nucleoside triphosphate hydrolase protein [Parachaetomium inaequale]
MPPSLKPLRAFDGVEEFARRHKAGTEAEFEATQKQVDAINKEDNKFQAWVVSKTRQTPKRSEYLVVVQPGPDGERKIPQQGEPAKLRIVFGDNSVTRFWDARRIENPLLSATAGFPDKTAAFKVTVHIAEAHDGVHTLMDTSETPNRTECDPDKTSSIGTPGSDSSDSGIGDCTGRGTPEPTQPSHGEIDFTNSNSVHVNFLLSASEATKNAELTALEMLSGRYINASERQLHAFNFFVTLRNPEFVVDLHEAIPHMMGAMDDPSWPDSPLGKKFALLNPQQKAAYIHGFRNLPCGISILPGGPGAGKTHFNLFTIVMAQSQPLPRPVMFRGRPEKRCAKVLFIVDMNSPVDDVANRMLALYKDLGMKKLVIRMKGWGAEVRSSNRLNAAEDAASGEDMQVDFANQFLRTANAMSLGSAPRSCQAPSLDEAAWQRYDEHKDTMYEGIAQYLAGELWENSEVVPQRFRRMVYNLYRDTLGAADFIATTPVAASNHFHGMFKPDLVFFDESPHARDLTNLIAIANFDPIAWIFCGDYRQTVPYVGSDADNIYREQMQISFMERAAVADRIPYELLVNHRAFGGLHELASIMWYGSRMISGNDRNPLSLAHVQNYLSKFVGGRVCTVPRVLVHLKNCAPEGRSGTSAWNPAHTAWVMARVLELLNDADFKDSKDGRPGTILIITPYKKAYNEYKNEVKQLPHWAQKRVEARTVDVCQGHEADFVFLDLVKEKSTKFLDDPNRLCVALTRARLGEVVMMHPNLPQSTTFQRNSQNLRPIYKLCQQAGQVAFVDPATIPAVSRRPETPVSEAVPSIIPDAISETASTTTRSTATPASVHSELAESIHSGLDKSDHSELGNSAHSRLDKVVALDQITAPANDMTCLAQNGDKKLVIHDAAPVVAYTATTKHSQEVAQMDGGEAWWSKVMGASAKKSTVHPDQATKKAEANPVSSTTDDKKIAEGAEETRKKPEDDARNKAEEEARKKMEEARQKAEEAARQKAEEEERKEAAWKPWNAATARPGETLAMLGAMFARKA